MRKLGIPAATVLQGLESRGSADSKIGKSLRIAAVLGGTIAVLAMLAICLLALSSLLSKAFASRDPGVPIGVSTPEQFPSLSDRAIDTVKPEATQPSTSSSPIDTVPTDSMSTSKTSAPSREATPPALTAVPSQPPVSDLPPNTDQLSAEHQSPSVKGKALSEHVRRNLEKQRRQSEYKRARLESLYEKHAISKDAYKKGEEEYQNDIQKYRQELGDQ